MCVISTLGQSHRTGGTERNAGRQIQTTCTEADWLAWKLADRWRKWMGIRTKGQVTTLGLISQ